ncbi:hypothetical protein DFH11DRAFT_1570064 [Phellopilus nigrolimitatus]|nr:hypothetical protein DFH11DRAFT_1570064 [Phellopilus nigrolimitatus]
MMLLKLVSLVSLFAAALAPVVWAQETATLFPEGFGPSDSLNGVIVGTGGQVGTTYVLSGVAASGVPFTITLAEDASNIAETVAIPTQSLQIGVGCIVSAGSAICQEVDSGPSATTTIVGTTAFSPFAVPVSTGSVAVSSGSSSSGTTSASASPSSSSAISQSTITPSGSASTATVLSTAVAPSSTQSASGASKVSLAGLTLLVFLVGTSWILV